MACVQLSVSGLKCLKVHLLCMDVINSLFLVQCLTYCLLDPFYSCYEITIICMFCTCTYDILVLNV